MWETLESWKVAQAQPGHVSHQTLLHLPCHDENRLSDLNKRGGKAEGAGCLICLEIDISGAGGTDGP